jgi:serine/threonine protein kinase/WD40 repeat protein
MVRRFETDPIDGDERLGEAIEAFLALAEGGEPPDPETFAARYPELNDDLRAALEGLALVKGLVGETSGPGHRLESGRRVAGYRIVRELGRGGMGTVYEAVHVDLDRPVALKVLGIHAAPDSNGRRRFLNEAKTAAGLHHTHIVPVFDVGQVGGLCYYAMQRIEGSGLDRVLRHLRRDRSVAAGTNPGGSTPGGNGSGWLGWSSRRSTATYPVAPRGSEEETGTWLGHSRINAAAIGPAAERKHEDEPTPFDPPRGSAYYRWVAEVGREAAEALAHAHRRGIIHRDVKPSNLLVDARGIVWVADFGLARRLTDPGLTHHDSLLGTPRYMSPEQAKTGPIDGRTDVYSLGATLYELLTLRPPFQGQSAAELVEQIGNREPTALRQFDPRIPRDLETIVLKTLSKRPADRYATAAELAEDLERFLHLEPVRARRISAAGRLWRFTRRHPGMSAVSTIAAATVLAVATTAYVRVIRERDRALASDSKAQDAIVGEKAANLKYRDALREQLTSSAILVRRSNDPNRRVTALKYLKDAAALDPEPVQRAKLRDEAVESLVLRNVEPSAGFPTGATRGIVFGPEGTRLAALSEDEFSLWDVASRKPLGRHQLSPTNPDPVTPPGAGGRRGGRRTPFNGVAMAGRSFMLVLPDGHGLRLLDTTTGAPVRDLLLPVMPGRRISSVIAAPDGHRLVTIEFVDPRSEHGRPNGPGGGPPHPPTIEYRLFDPDRIATPIKALAQWEVSPAAGWVRNSALVAISPDGKFLATARGGDTAVALWASDDGRSLGTIESQVELTALAFGPSGLLATAGGGEIRLWEIETRMSVGSFNPYQSYVRLLRFNPRGTLLALAGFGADIELWDPSTHDVVAVLPTTEHPDDVAFSHDGRTLAASSGKTATTSVWTVVSAVARVQLSGFDSLPTTLAFRDDGALAIGSTLKGTIRFWQPGTCPSATQEVDMGTAPETGSGDRPAALVFDDQQRLISVDSEAVRFGPSLAADAGRPSRSVLPEPRGRFGRNYGPFAPPIAFAPRGRTLFVARGPQVLAWRPDDPDHWETLRLPRGGDASRGDRERHRGDPPPLTWGQIATSPTGDRLYLLEGSLAGGDVSAVTVEGTRTQRLAWDFPPAATCLALSADGSVLAIGDRTGHVTLLDTTRGTSQSRFSVTAGENEGGVSRLAFAPSGRELAVGIQPGRIELWSLGDKSAPLLHLPPHRGFLTTLAFDTTGRHLASAGSDKIVAVWDLELLRNELGRIGLAW